ncbi:hypothetical protein [Nocardia sp. NRRL S-836]|uniref:hypothetical protein n=1 Tax=Nocardia sp. NRRL S-836 TaxID=1519492 RepID=UPI0006AFA59E|nr:hypothetical protein [Nocardia sp. NRRL S-836]KOV87239.1 hypothetical protein ADL03_07875 [Nocardia sp. NRRL S-836]
MTIDTRVRAFDRARAAELARSGNHAGAVRLLEELGQEHDTLDLLARVHAQRGDLAAAHATWSRVLADDPAHPSALAGTRLITEITEGSRRARPLPVAVVAGAAAVVTAAALAALISLPRHEEPPVAALPARVTTQPVAQTPTAPDPRPALVAELTNPDVVLQPHADGVRVVFRHGMFPPDSTELGREGRRQLEQWGRLLRGRNVRVTVYGHGVVVPGSPATGGSATAVERAAAAVEVLTSAGDLPATAFVVRSADQAEAPHVGADPSLNRTVTLVVTPG